MGGRVNLNELENEVWRTYFRFSKDEVARLVKVLDLPSEIRGDNGVIEYAQDALCMLLARLTYPNRYTDLRLKFGWEVTRTSRIQAAIQDFILQRWRFLLDFDEQRLCSTKLQEYANVISAKIPGGAMTNCWGFVDGTVRPTCRPIRYQRTVYNGWKRLHGLKYHAIVTPDGLIAHLYGPLEGRRHNRTIWSESQIMQYLELYAYGTQGQPLQLYGDPAYGCNKFICAPFLGAKLTPQEQEFNKRMANVRIIVEWVFKEILNLFPFLDFKRNQKLLLQPVGKQFQVAALLHNAHVCLHQPQIPQYFQDCITYAVQHESNNNIQLPHLFQPPTLEEYFHR